MYQLVKRGIHQVARHICGYDILAHNHDLALQLLATQRDNLRAQQAYITSLEQDVQDLGADFDAVDAQRVREVQLRRAAEEKIIQLQARIPSASAELTDKITPIAGTKNNHEFTPVDVTDKELAALMYELNKPDDEAA